MDGENNGKPYYNGWFGRKTHYFRKHLYRTSNKKQEKDGLVIYQTFMVLLFKLVVSYDCVKSRSIYILNVFITACVKPTQTSATNNFKKQQCFFETFNNFWIFFFLQKEVSETTFCRKNNFNKVSRSFKKQLFAEKTILQSFKKFQKQVSRRNRREN